jgi:hypothetical protein
MPKEYAEQEGKPCRCPLAGAMSRKSLAQAGWWGYGYSGLKRLENDEALKGM